jgi:hypothetical protein
MKGLRWLAPALFVVEVVLVATGRLALGPAVVVLVAVEAAVLVTVLTCAAVHYRRSRRSGVEPATARVDALHVTLPRPVARAIRRELDLVTAVVRWAMRRPQGLPEGAPPQRDDGRNGELAYRLIPYGRDQVALVWLFICITAVEIAVVEFLVPWPALRLVLLLVGVYGMLVMAGFVAINRTRPHVLTAQHIRLRCGSLADVRIPLDGIASVRRDLRGAGYGPVITGDVLTLGVGGRTQVTITLTASTDVDAGVTNGVVRAVRIAADDPRTAVAVLRAATADRPPAATGSA